MKISDLPIGAMIYFGSEKRRDGVIDMVWVKVNGQNGFCTNGSAAYCFMDAIEPQSESRDRRTHGSNFFPQTNIAQWLNASGNNWYTPQHEDDCPPSYTNMPGFLTNFDEDELRSITPHEIVVVVPNGFRRKFGETYRHTCKVSIPAYSQIVATDDSREGQQFEFFRDNMPRGNFMTRTAINAKIKLYSDGRMSAVSPVRSVEVMPYICLDGNAVVSDKADSNNVYYIMQPDEKRAEMRNALMELLA